MKREEEDERIITTVTNREAIEFVNRAVEVASEMGFQSPGQTMERAAGTEYDAEDLIRLVAGTSVAWVHHVLPDVIPNDPDGNNTALDLCRNPYLMGFVLGVLAEKTQSVKMSAEEIAKGIGLRPVSGSVQASVGLTVQ